MKRLIIEPSEFTPKVIFDPENSNFEMSGFSRPEDVRTFYKPLLEWLEEFDEEVLSKDLGKRFNSEPLKFIFRFNYFNSASSKFILDLLIFLNTLYVRGILIEVDWYYEEGDDEILESGEEMKDMVDYKFVFIPYTIMH